MAALPQYERYVVAGPVTLRSFTGRGTWTIPEGLFGVAYDDGPGPQAVNGSLFRTERDAQTEADWYNRGQPD
jgi:hypothetical protein